jgi:hypothetical protein
MTTAITAALLAGCDRDRPVTATPTPGPTDNGIAALDAPEILRRAQTALAGAGSYRMKGTVDNDGQKIDIDMRKGGGNVQGTIGIDGGILEVLQIGSDLYLRAEDSVWKGFLPKEQHALLGLFSGKHVKVDADNPSFGGFAEMFDPKEILPIEGAPTKGGPTTVGSTPAITVVNEAGDGTLHVATVGEPYPLKVEGVAGEGSIEFTDYGAPLTVTTPPADQVLDLDALMNRN